MTAAQQKVHPLKPSKRFVLRPFDKIVPSPERNYVVKGLIPREGLTVVWGPPKCGKSFWCFDLALHVALGWEYRDHRVNNGTVVYVALEGGLSFGNRAEAFRQAKLSEGYEEPPFHLIVDRLDLIKEQQLLIDSIRAQLGDEQPEVIFIDTLNRSLSGSESSDQDMSAYVVATDAVRVAFKCAVVIVHHCGIDGTRPRGHTALTGAADAQLAVKRDTSAGVFTVKVEFMKDGAEGDMVACQLETLEVGVDQDGESVTSCVVREAAAPAQKPSHLTAKQKRAVNALENVLIEAGKPEPSDRHYPSGSNVVGVELWRKHLLAAGVIDKEGTNPRQDFKRLKDQLITKSAIGEWNDLIWKIGDL